MPKRRANGEGNIRKRKDGRWEGRYTVGLRPGNRQSASSRTCWVKRRPKSRRNSRPQSAKVSGWTYPKLATTLLQSWVRTWYEVYAEPRIRPNTKAYYTNYIENHIIPGIGRRPAGQADHHPDPAVLQQPPKERTSSAQEFSRTQGQEPQSKSGAGRPHATAQLLGTGGGGAAAPRQSRPRLQAAAVGKERNEDPAARENRNVPRRSGKTRTCWRPSIWN